MKTLTLRLKKKWFNMILSGEKTEEYRDIKLFYDRLFKKEYNCIRFINGYATNAPEFFIELHSIEKGLTKLPFAENAGKLVYVLKLGKIIKR
jgi:hypothetical protein